MSRRSSINTTVNVDIADLMDELTDEDLIAELHDRDVKWQRSVTPEEIYQMLVAGRGNEALATLARDLDPKHDPKRGYELAKQGKHPFLKVGSA